MTYSTQTGDMYEIKYWDEFGNVSVSRTIARSEESARENFRVGYKQEGIISISRLLNPIYKNEKETTNMAHEEMVKEATEFLTMFSTNQDIQSWIENTYAVTLSTGEISDIVYKLEHYEEHTMDETRPTEMQMVKRAILDLLRMDRQENIKSTSLDIYSHEIRSYIEERWNVSLDVDVISELRGDRT